MRTRQRIVIGLVALALLTLANPKTRCWGQASIRIGDVVTVEGKAEVRRKAWERLGLADPVLLLETVRTHMESKMQALLQQHNMTWTLFELGEIEFTESLLPRCRRSLQQTMNVHQGSIRLAQHRIDRETEVRTPNAVICVSGTVLIIIYDPQVNTTEVICLEGTVSVQNQDQAVPDIALVPQNFRSRVVEANAPTVPEAIPPAELKTLERERRVIAQIPRELLPDERLPELPTPENSVHEVGINPHTAAIEDPSASPSARDFLESILDITIDIPR